MTDSAERRVRGYRLVPTFQGDTLQAVAARELGDAARWTELAAMNNLAPPYLVDDLAALEDDGGDGTGTTRVALAGLALKAPANAPRPTGVADATDIFGTDLDLTDGVLRVSETGDLAVVSDLANLRQALRHRVETRAGELLFHPHYGSRLHELIGQRSGPIRAALAAAYADRALRSDPRVAQTEGTLAEVGDGTGSDVARVSSTVVTVDGKHLPIGGE